MDAVYAVCYWRSIPDGDPTTEFFGPVYISAFFGERVFPATDPLGSVGASRDGIGVSLAYGDPYTSVPFRGVCRDRKYAIAGRGPRIPSVQTIRDGFGIGCGGCSQREKCAMRETQRIAKFGVRFNIV
jgi:hypothetical protein